MNRVEELVATAKRINARHPKSPEHLANVKRLLSNVVIFTPIPIKDKEMATIIRNTD